MTDNTSTFGNTGLNNKVEFYTTVDWLRIEFNPRLTWLLKVVIGKFSFHFNPELANPNIIATLVRTVPCITKI
jgi:hypothetical protein